MNVKAVSACASPSWSTLIWETAPGWKSRVVMTAEGNSTGGLTAGFESMISNVLPGFSADLNAYSSMRSSRVSLPGNLRLSALKWSAQEAWLVTGSPDAFRTYQVPPKPISPWPCAMPGPESLTKVYSGQWL